VGESTQAEEQQMYRPAFMRQAFRLRLWVALTALALSACGAGGDTGSGHQQAKGHPLPKYAKASLPAGEYHTTEFEPSLSFRITGDDWRFEGPSGTLGDPEHPDYLFFQKVPEAEISFFNLRKVKGVYKPRGSAGAIEPMPTADKVVGWLRHHPYLEISKPEPMSVGGAEGVQFDVVVANPPKGDSCVNIFALSTGGPSEACDFHKARYIVLEDVKGVPVVIQYGDEDFDKFVPVAEKVLQSVEWTGT
jgi:hypothetical protein